MVTFCYLYIVYITKTGTGGLIERQDTRYKVTIIIYHFTYEDTWT
jgi:hypothetical protein